MCVIFNVVLEFIVVSSIVFIIGVVSYIFKLMIWKILCKFCILFNIWFLVGLNWGKCYCNLWFLDGLLFDEMWDCLIIFVCRIV